MKKVDVAMTALRDEVALREMTSEALSAVVQWQSNALDSIRDGVLITDAQDPNQALSYANVAFEKMTGYTAAEIAGTNCRFLQGPDTDPETKLTIRKALAEQKPCSVTILNYRKNGEPFWNDLRITPMFNSSGVLTHFVAALNDISDQIRAFRLLSDSEAEARDLFASMDFGFCVVQLIYDSQGKVVDWLYLDTNQHFEEHSGLRDVRGKRLKQVIPNIEAHWLERFSHIAATGEAQRFVDTSPALDRWFDVLGFRFGDVGADCVAFTFSDISERKKEEARIIAARDAAERSREAAESASRAKSSFLANMSHDIRTPLTAILGFAEILEQTLTEPDDLQSAAIIRQNVDYLESLLGDILDLAKIEAGKLPVKVEKLSLPGLIDDVISLMRARAVINGMRLSVEYAGAVPEFVMTDKIRVRQVLINLLSNAIKFTSTDITRTFDVGVRVRYDASASYPLSIDVVDFGIGISEEQQRILFEPFVQVENKEGFHQGGTGLGLSICRRLAGLLDGDVSVESELHKGSTFTLHLPVNPEENIALITPDTQSRFEAENLQVAQVVQARILVVDDRPDIRSFLQSHLESAGADVVSVADGQSAIDRIAGQGKFKDATPAENHFDLVLMDMQMPGMDGLETTLALRSQGFCNPIIALTASVMPEEQQRCLDAGCNVFMAKPIKRERLIRVVSDLISPVAKQRSSSSTSAFSATVPIAQPDKVRTQVQRKRHPERATHERATTSGKRTVLFVEDDLNTCRAMKRIIESDGWSVVIAHSVKEAIVMVDRHRPQVILTDFSLPDGSGSDLMRQLASLADRPCPPAIVLSGMDIEDDENLFVVELLKPATRSVLVDTLNSVCKDLAT